MKGDHPPPPIGNGWNEWKNYVLSMLRESQKAANLAEARLQTIEREMLQIKMWLKVAVIAIIVLLPVSNTVIKELALRFFDGIPL